MRLRALFDFEVLAIAITGIAVILALSMFGCSKQSKPAHPARDAAKRFVRCVVTKCVPEAIGQASEAAGTAAAE